MKIVVLDSYTLNPGDLSWKDLCSIGEVEIYDRTSSEQIVERCLGAEIVLTNKTPLTAQTLTCLTDCKYIGVLATGYDVVDVRQASLQNIYVCNIPDYGTRAVAQFVFALILELCHQVGQHSQSVRHGDWQSSPDWCYWKSPQIELSGKTLGILGAGRIGMQTAEIAKCFGMKVLASNSKEERFLQVPFEDFQWVSNEELIKKSDFLSLHCPLTDKTEGIINASTLQLMKSSAFLINTSRGRLVDEHDLAQALRQQTISGAAVDVLSVEPPLPNNPLIGAPNCLITPHIAWATREARNRLIQLTVDNISSFLAGNPKNVVNKG